MPQTRLAIELAPDRLEVARLRGHSVVGAARQWLDPERWESAWREGLRPLDGPLRLALQSLGVTKGIADVFHHGPESIAEITTHGLPAEGARQATLLAMADQIGVGLANQPHWLQVLASDRADDGKRSSHVLFLADSANSAECLVNWLDRAELSVGRIAPAQGQHIGALVARMTHAGGEPTVALRLGEQKSVIIVASRGRVRLARNLGLGVARLAESLTRPITTTERGEVKLTLEEARALVFEHGVPQRGTRIEKHGLTATDILPAIQPVLQRCLVELRQSLRFGLSNDDRENARLLVVGPGAAIPRLAEVLGQECQLRSEVADVGGFAHDQPACAGSDLIDAIGAGTVRASLLPAPLAEARAMARMRAALITGAAAALSIGVLQAMSWSGAAMRARSEAASFSTQVAQVRELETLRDTAAARAGGVAALERAIERSLGATPGFAAFLHELPGLLPSTVRILDVRAVRDERGATVELSACAMTHDPGDRKREVPPPTRQIADLVAAIDGTGLADSVRLGSSQSTSMDGAPAMQFTLTVHLAGVPTSLMAFGEAEEGAHE